MQFVVVHLKKIVRGFIGLARVDTARFRCQDACRICQHCILSLTHCIVLHIIVGGAAGRSPNPRGDFPAAGRRAGRPARAPTFRRRGVCYLKSCKVRNVCMLLKGTRGNVRLFLFARAAYVSSSARAGAASQVFSPSAPAPACSRCVDIVCHYIICVCALTTEVRFEYVARSTLLGQRFVVIGIIL